MNWISTVTGVVFGGWNTRLKWRFSGFLSSASLFFRRRTRVRDGMSVVTACSAFTITCELVHTTVAGSRAGQIFLATSYHAI